MNSYCTDSFWKQYEALPPQVKRAADKAYALWKRDTAHPSLRFKPIQSRPGEWSVRIDSNHRAVCIKLDDGWLWYAIGDHDYFDRLAT